MANRETGRQPQARYIRLHGDDNVAIVARGRRKVWCGTWGVHNDFVLFNPAPIT